MKVNLAHAALAMAVVATLGACTQSSGSTDAGAIRPQHAGQPMDPVVVAARLAAARAAGIVGDEKVAREQFEALNHDFQRSMKIPDPSRRIPHEPARVAAKTVDGVGSVLWLDTQNLLVRVRGSEYRNNATIDQVCHQLEPLGDTLGIVINLQDATATTADGMATLSRDCQLEAGDRAFMQQTRQVDVVDASLRAQHRADAPTNAARPRRRSKPNGDQDALNAIPEI